MYAIRSYYDLRIMTRHLLCAAFELPFRQGEAYGGYGNVDPMLEALTEDGVLLKWGLFGVWLSAAVYVILLVLFMGWKFREGKWKHIEI